MMLEQQESYEVPPAIPAHSNAPERPPSVASVNGSMPSDAGTSVTGRKQLPMGYPEEMCAAERRFRDHGSSMLEKYSRLHEKIAKVNDTMDSNLVELLNDQKHDDLPAVKRFLQNESTILEQYCNILERRLKLEAKRDELLTPGSEAENSDMRALVRTIAECDKVRGEEHELQRKYEPLARSLEHEITRFLSELDEELWRAMQKTATISL